MMWEVCGGNDEVQGVTPYCGRLWGSICPGGMCGGCEVQGPWVPIRPQQFCPWVAPFLFSSGLPQLPPAARQHTFHDSTHLWRPRLPAALAALLLPLRSPLLVSHLLRSSLLLLLHTRAWHCKARGMQRLRDSP